MNLRAWVALGVVALIILLTLAFCSERSRRQSAQSEGRVAVATGEALDDVAKKTPAIRQDQEEKQDAVRDIEGSDTRLPDGYGARLECVRRRTCQSDNP